ncbi:hypothetical protein [Bacillus sp. SIMBA_033]|uniref:hypothetical protein n=1 Tax=unclassified Bacillus (in: firmicutes) TaxID=185979 RepID=UPI00397AA13F
MNRNIESMLEGFNERMKHIAMFSPILRLEQPMKFKELPIPTVALYVLLYMLENKLAFNKNTTKEELQYVILEVVRRYWNEDFTKAEADELEDWLVSKKLRNRGKAHTFTYYDFDKREEKTHYFHLIEYGEGTNVFSDREDSLDDFTLTSMGLELLFKTKEVFGELRITISQLFFKRQFEKGLFTDALRRIHEMHTLIEDEKKRIKKLQSTIIKDALGVSQRSELEAMIKRIDETLKTEREQFKDLQNLVEEKIDEYHEGRLTEKEQKGIHIIQEIEGKLLQAISLHESLFTEKQKTQNIMSESLESSIIHAFSVHLDFEQEILRELIETPATEEVLNAISKPFLPLRHHKIFNPLLAISPQKRYKQKQLKEEEIVEVDEETKRMQEQEEARKKEEIENKEYRCITALLKHLVEKDKYLLSDVFQMIETQDVSLYEDILYNPDPLLGLIAELHQSEYNRFEKVTSDVWKNLPDDKKINRMLIRLSSELSTLQEIGSFSLLETDKSHYIGTMKYKDMLIIRGDFYGVDTRYRE